MPHRRVALPAAALVLLATFAGAALQWYEHYQRGLAYEQSGAWSDAARELYAAVAQERAPRLRVRTYGANFLFGYDPHFHLARCLVELGRFVEAGGHLGVSFRSGVTPRAELESLRSRIEAGMQARPGPRVASQDGQLTVSSDPTGADLEIDGKGHGTTPAGPIALEPGAHHLRLRAQGCEVEERSIELVPGPNAVHLSLRPLLTAAEAPTTPPTPTPVSRPTPPPPTATPTAVPALPVAPSAAPVMTTPAEAPAASPSATATPAATPLRFPERRSPWLPLIVVAGVLAAVALYGTVRHRRRATAPTRHAPVTTVFSGAPALLGQYRVLGTLGRGGMATTFRAERISDGTAVALKVPHEMCLADPSFVARFVREGKLGEQLHHPGIVRIFEAGEEQGRPFLAMELLGGRTLKEEIRHRGPLALKRALEITVDIGEALDYAHAKGVVHRDLKPENVMVLDDGSLKVMDFGIARVAGEAGLTTSHLFIGTPLYAAPEMTEPRTIDHRSDLYSLGIVLFEMLQGVVPFSAESPLKVLEMHVHRPLPARAELARPVPEAVWRVVVRLCEKDPALRYPSAAPLLVEMRQLLRRLSEVEAEGG